MTLDEQIEVMCAFRDGEEVELFDTEDSDEGWLPLEGNIFMFDRFIYRIKTKKPKVIYVNEYDNELTLKGYTYNSKIAAIEAAGNIKRSAVKYIEVIE